MDTWQVDDLVSWVYEMNENYSVEGQDVFDEETLSKVFGGIIIIIIDT